LEIFDDDPKNRHMNFLDVESESECWGKEKSFGEFNEKMQ